MSRAPGAFPRHLCYNQDMADHDMTAIEIMTRIDTMLGRRLARRDRGSDDHTDESVSQHIAILTLARRVLGTFSPDVEAELERRADILNERLDAAVRRRPDMAAA